MNSDISSLSQMMIRCAEDAIIADDYVNALEYLIAVKSVDDHPDVLLSLTLAILEIIEALDLTAGAFDARMYLLIGSSSRTANLLLTDIREYLSNERLSDILLLIRSVSENNLIIHRRSDGLAAAIVGKIADLASDYIPSPAVTPARDYLEWQRLKIDGSQESIETFLRHWPNSKSAVAAGARLAVLRRKAHEEKLAQSDKLLSGRTSLVPRQIGGSRPTFPTLHQYRSVSTDEIVAINTLRGGIIEALDDLISALQGSNAYVVISRIAERYRSAISSESVSIDQLYVYGIRLENARRKLELAVKNGDVPDIHVAAAEAMDSILALHRPIIYSTERGRELVERARAFNAVGIDRPSARMDINTEEADFTELGRQKAKVSGIVSTIAFLLCALFIGILTDFSFERDRVFVLILSIAGLIISTILLIVVRMLRWLNPTKNVRWTAWFEGRSS